MDMDAPEEDGHGPNMAGVDMDDMDAPAGEAFDIGSPDDGEAAPHAQESAQPDYTATGAEDLDGDTWATDAPLEPPHVEMETATTDALDAAAPGEDGAGAFDGPMLVDQEWEPEEDDPFADLPAPPDPDEAWRPAAEEEASPEPAHGPDPQTPTAQDMASPTGEEDDPFSGLPLPPDSPLAGPSPRAEAPSTPAPASAHKKPAPSPQKTSPPAEPPRPEPALRREGPRIYTPKPRGSAPAAPDAASKRATKASAHTAHRPHVIVSGSAQWERDDSHELEDTMFRLGVDEDLAHDILAPSGDMAKRDRDFITKETRRALKEGGSIKNPSTAFLLSLVLPGFGNVYAGNPWASSFRCPPWPWGYSSAWGRYSPATP